MNEHTKLNFLLSGLVLAAFLLPWQPYRAAAFPQNGGQAGSSAGNAKASQIVMKEVSGKVLETMSGGGYSYALVEKDGTKTWVALPKSNIAVGDEIACSSGMIMNNFRSTSLNRTFAQIVFSSGATITSSTSTPTGNATTAPETTEPPKPKPPEDWKNF